MISYRGQRWIVVGLLLVLVSLLAACATDSGVPTQEGTPSPTALPVSGLQLAVLPTPTLASGVVGITPLPPQTPSPEPPTATPTVTPTPTPTPLPAEQVALGQGYLEQGDSDRAAREFQAALDRSGQLTLSLQQEALWGLSRAYMNEERWSEATDALNQHLSLFPPSPSSSGPNKPSSTSPTASGPAIAAEAYFYLGEAGRLSDNCEAAITAYQTYLDASPEMAAYVWPRIGDCYLLLGDSDQGWAAYERAAEAPAQRLTRVELRQKLADHYLELGDYRAAIVQYDAIHDIALTENTRGQMTYLAGQAELLAGNQEAAYERFLTAVEKYPRAYASYQGLVLLVEGGVPVDLFQRGLVDYYAGAYMPAVSVFTSYLENAPDSYRADTHLYLAWSQEALGNLEAALAQLETYASYGAGPEETAGPYAAEAAVERAKVYARAGLTAEAVAAYQQVVTDYPGTEEAEFAIWWAAVLSEQLSGAAGSTVERYQAVAEQYPEHDEADRALFEAGMLRWQQGDEEAALSSWKDLLEQYPGRPYGAAGFIWLMRLLPDEEAASSLITATAQLQGDHYYSQRAREMAEGIAPFQSPAALKMAADEVAEQAEAEAWLEEWLSLEPGSASSGLSEGLAQDGHLVRGSQLWRLGLYPEAKRELEELRQAHVRNALASYQLALYFRDLGLYRSSILAADALLLLSGQSVFDVPRLIGRLSYPVYYSQLIMPLADSYDYDPLLQFSLVRQESLFESFISSHVGAQGLSQVMPDTGVYIARRLDWPGFENADLYRPYVGLAFGAFYLDEQLATFDGNVYAALSAYNAGPGNALRWYALAPDDPDLYLETVDFSETRTYIQRIYTGYTIYRYLYGE